MDRGNRLLEVPVSIARTQVSAMIDCGATHNFIACSLVEQLGQVQRECQALAITLADRSTIMATRECTISVLFGAESVELTFVVVERLSTPLVLGMSFLEAVNPTIDWVLKQVTWSADSGEVFLQGSVWSHQGQLQLMSIDSLLQAKEAGTVTGFWRVDIGVPGGGTCCNAIGDASATEPLALTALLNDFTDVFAVPESMPPERTYAHEINLYDEGVPPPKLRQYRLTQEEQQAIRDNIDLYLKRGWVRPSHSNYGHPILIIRKKDGKLRMAVDYRTLNAKTVPDRHPLPRIDDILDSLSGKTVFSKLDLDSGYHQVRLAEGHQQKTAFLSKWGLYEYTVMPLGLTNAPATFQRLMNDVLRPYLDRFASVYLDDILVASSNFDEHLDHLRAILTELRKHKLYAKRPKCAFAQPQLEYLGHVIDSSGVAPDSEKVAAVQNWPSPADKHDVQVFLGMAGYYSRFVKQYAHRAAPLTDLLRKDQSWQWTSREAEAFDALKMALATAPVLLYPNFQLPFVYATDASAVAIGATLLQDHGRGLQPLQYFSRKLNSAETRYSTEDREFLAVKDSTVRWRHYLAGGCARAVCLTDHKPLTHLYTRPTLSNRQARWMEKIVDVNPVIEWRQGSRHIVPDALSRRPDHGKLGQVPQPSLATVLVEPSFLGNVSRCSFDPQDLEMRQLVALAQSPQSNFRIEQRFGLPVVIRSDPSGMDQLVIPSGSGLRDLLVQELHCTPLVGHPGVRKTVKLLYSRVWWPRLRSFVTGFIRGCDSCQRIKDSTQLPAGLMQPLPVPSGKFQDFSLDFITDLPLSANCNTLLVIVDRLTKYTQLIPCFSGPGQPLSVGEVAKLVFDSIVCRFGVPVLLVTDRDSRFTTELWKEIWRLMGSKTLLSTAYHPQTDGQTERMNRTVGQMLRGLLLQGDQSEWAAKVKFVEFGMNTSVSVSTGVTPFELVFGVVPRLPVDAMLGAEPRNSSGWEFVAKCKQLIEVAQNRMQQSQIAQKRQYDKHHRALEFIPGDLVLLSTKSLKVRGKRKLVARWIGPFVVESKVGQLAYRLLLPDLYSNLHPVFHISKLKPYVSYGGDGMDRQPAPVKVDGDYEYEVERIVGQRGRGRRTQYLVRWKGYGPEFDLWLSAPDLVYAPDVLAAWKALHN